MNNLEKQELLTEEQLKVKKIVNFLKEINESEDAKKLAEFLGCREDQVATSLQDFEERQDIIAYIGDFTIRHEKFIKNYASLKFITGDFDFPLDDTIGLENICFIGGQIICPTVKNVQGFKNLRGIGDRAYFDFLEDARGLENLIYIQGVAYFDYLKDTEPLKNCNKYDAINHRLEMHKIHAEETKRQLEEYKNSRIY